MAVYSCGSNIKGFAVVSRFACTPGPIFSAHLDERYHLNKIGKSFALAIALESTGASFVLDYSFPLNQTPFFLSHKCKLFTAILQKLNGIGAIDLVIFAITKFHFYLDKTKTKILFSL